MDAQRGDAVILDDIRLSVDVVDRQRITRPRVNLPWVEVVERPHLP
jgi:hypothetical protein